MRGVKGRGARVGRQPSPNAAMAPLTDLSATTRDTHRDIEAARRVLATEIAGLSALAQSLDRAFVEAVEMLACAAGRVIVTGMGKSGHIARKIASTLASTGTPALFVHPAEAAHGDLGMITAQDVLVAISYSGEAGELMAIVPIIKRMGTRFIAITGNGGSSLAQ